MTAYEMSITQNGITIKRDKFRVFWDYMDTPEEDETTTCQCHRFDISEVFLSIKEDNNDDEYYNNESCKRDIYKKLIDHIFSFITEFRDRNLLFLIGLEDTHWPGHKIRYTDIKLTWDGKLESKSSFFQSLEIQVNQTDNENGEFDTEMLSIQVLSVLTTYEIYNGNKTFKQEECCACMTNKTNVLFCNCGHICICERCLPLNRENKCPVCKKFSNIIRII